MKLRTFKKSIHRKKPYWHDPRCNSKIFLSVEDPFIYYTCHNLSGRYCLTTKEFVYIIKKKRKRHGKD